MCKLHAVSQQCPDRIWLDARLATLVNSVRFRGIDPLGLSLAAEVGLRVIARKGRRVCAKRQDPLINPISG